MCASLSACFLCFIIFFYFNKYLYISFVWFFLFPKKNTKKDPLKSLKTGNHCLFSEITVASDAFNAKCQPMRMQLDVGEKRGRNCNEWPMNPNKFGCVLCVELFAVFAHVESRKKKKKKKEKKSSFYLKWFDVSRRDPTGPTESNGV